MPDRETDNSEIRDDAWQQVKQALGKPALSKFAAEQQQDLQHLVAAAVMHRDADGPVRSLHSLLGDSWIILVLLLLHFGPLRFSVLQRMIDAIDSNGISRRMLSLGLRSLEREGMVARHVVVPVPPNVEYSLTPMGEELRLHVIAYTDWAEKNSTSIAAARQAFAEKNAT
jgi:DNA-binding HxlR family transcriptional regulator